MPSVSEMGCACSETQSFQRRNQSCRGSTGKSERIDTEGRTGLFGALCSRVNRCCGDGGARNSYVPEDSQLYSGSSSSAGPGIHVVF